MQKQKRTGADDAPAYLTMDAAISIRHREGVIDLCDCTVHRSLFDRSAGRINVLSNNEQNGLLWNNLLDIG